MEMKITLLRVCTRKISDLALLAICPIKILVNDDFVHLLRKRTQSAFAIDFDIQSNVIVTAVPYGPHLPSPHHSVLSQFPKASI